MTTQEQRDKQHTMERILKKLQQLPPEMVEKFLEDLMWMLDDLWREEGIPDDLEKRIRRISTDGAVPEDKSD